MLTVKKLKYADFISIITSKNLYHQHVYDIAEDESFKHYELFAIDGNIEYSCNLYSNTESNEILDYEANWRLTANKTIDLRDSFTGVPKYRPRPVEGTMAVVSIYCNLGMSETLDPNGNLDFRAITTTPGKTEIRFKPSYGYYITGGHLKLRSDLTTPFIKANFIFAPDFPSAYGGNWCFINNLKVDNIVREFDVDVPSKYIKYYVEAPAASELCLQIFHDVNEHVEIEMRICIYI